MLSQEIAEVASKASQGELEERQIPDDHCDSVVGLMYFEEDDEEGLSTFYSNYIFDNIWQSGGHGSRVASRKTLLFQTSWKEVHVPFHRIPASHFGQ